MYTRSNYIVLGLTLLYTLGFGVYFVLSGDQEFMWYIGVLLFFVVLVAVTLPRTKLDTLTLSGLSLWGFLHVAGGGIKIGAGKLYGLVLIPLVQQGELSILKYDQVVHMFGFAIAAVAIFQLLRPRIAPKVSWGTLYVIIICASAGLGSFNEIVEFIAVLLFPDNGVGGYYNSLDLIFNLLGAILAVAFIHYYYQPNVSAPVGKGH